MLAMMSETWFSSVLVAWYALANVPLSPGIPIEGDVGVPGFVQSASRSSGPCARGHVLSGVSLTHVATAARAHHARDTEVTTTVTVPASEAAEAG